MLVSAVRTVLITSPWTGDPFWDATQPFDRTSALVEVTTDEGVTGLGETVMGYFCPEAVPPLVDHYGRLLIDLRLDPLQPADAGRELYQRSLWWGRAGMALSVLSAIEMALWDIAGKAQGMPVHRLLGTAHRDLPLYASGGTGSWPIARAVEQATAYAGLGFRGLKLGTGLEGRPGGRVTGHEPPYGTWYAGSTAARIADEREKIGAIRDAVGPDVELAVDSHAVQVREPWSRRSALDLALAIEPFDLLFYEEPLRYDDPEGYAELRRRTRIPIAGGECLTGLAEFRIWFQAGALDVAQPDASHVGGVSVCRAVAALAEAHKVDLIVHTGASVGPGLMANLHVAFASPNSRFVEYALAPENVRTELLVEPLTIVEGSVEAPTAPGLGVSMPPGFAEAHPYRPGAIEYA